MFEHSLFEVTGIFKSSYSLPGLSLCAALAILEKKEN